jgi:hypothetical protein
MTGNSPEFVGGELAVPGHFAQRTAGLAQQPQPVVRWQRAIWGHAHVRPDDTIAVAVRGDGDRWWSVVLDPSSGQVPGRSSSPRRIILGEAMPPKAYGALTVTALLRNDAVVVRGEDGRTGLISWEQPRVPRTEFEAGTWCAWLNSEHPDTGLLVPHGTGASRRLALPDQFTGQVKWDVNWSESAMTARAIPTWKWTGSLLTTPPHQQHTQEGRTTGPSRLPPDGNGGIRLAPTYFDNALPGEPPSGLAGVNEANGTPMWHIHGPRTNGLHWKHPAYLGSSGGYVIIVGVPGFKDDSRQPAPTATGPCSCSCQDDDEESAARRATCEKCGRVRQAYITLAVHDRSTGQPLWYTRWSDRTAPHTPAVGVADIRGNVVLTREGYYLRARNVEDGRLLWTTVPPPRYQLVRQDNAPESQWAWLRQPEADQSQSPSPPEGGHLFIHASTGRQLTISNAFHQTRDGLVLTCTDDTLTCLELP